MIRHLLFSLLAWAVLTLQPAHAENLSMRNAHSLSGGNTMVVLKTSLGDITIELNAEKAPISVKNFLEYVDAGFYDGTIFHRVIPDFMIQGGGMTPDMKQKATRDSITNEADNGLKNLHGTIAMARTRDVNSATAQFFINLVDNGFLDHSSHDFGYAVFGKVVDGLEVVEKIGGVKTTRNWGQADIPAEAILINSAQRVENKPPKADVSQQATETQSDDKQSQ